MVEKNKIKPIEVSIGSHKKVIVDVKSDTNGSRRQEHDNNKTGLRTASIIKVLAGFNDLATLPAGYSSRGSDRNWSDTSNSGYGLYNRKASGEVRTGWQRVGTPFISTRSGGVKCPHCSGHIPERV